jgi:hypothetical protein
MGNTDQPVVSLSAALLVSTYGAGCVQNRYASISLSVDKTVAKVAD